MKRRETRIIELLTHNQWCYSIPPYQRPYEWTIDQWHSLIHDIAKAATNAREHWIGIILTSEATNKCDSYSAGGAHECWEIIDGQQRVVTLRLFVMALVDHHDQFDPENPTRLARALNPLRAQAADQPVLDEIKSGQWVNLKPLPPKPFAGPLAAYLYFRWILWLGTDAFLHEEPIPIPKPSAKKADEALTLWQRWEKAIRLEQEKNPETPMRRSGRINCIDLLKATYNQLAVLELRHQPQVDEDPEVIFESLNGKRLALSQFDHVRNYVFTKMQPRQRQQVYDDVWRKSERRVADAQVQARGASNLETFLYDYLISKGEAAPQQGINRARGARHLVRYWNSSRHDFNRDSIVDFVRQDFLPSMAYWLSAKTGAPILEPNATERPLSESQRRSILRIDSMSSGPFTPLIMGVLRDFMQNRRETVWLDDRLNAIEAFAARHVLLGTDLSPFRTVTMAIASKCLGRNGIDLVAHLAENMPTNTAITNAVENAWRREQDTPGSDDFGERLKPTQICAIFDGIEQQLAGSLATHIVAKRQSKESGFSIEHIYPQKSKKWRSDLTHWGLSEKKIREMGHRVHSLGNITVLRLSANISLGNDTLAKKQQKHRQASTTALNVDDDWLNAEQWTTEEIASRTQRLIDTALRRWPIPTT